MSTVATIGVSITGTTTISAGTVQVGAAGTTGVIGGAIVNNSAPTVQVAANDNWGTGTNLASLNAAFAQSGAFAFAAGSRDAAVITDLAPGSYSIQVSGVGDSVGNALVEVYDITPDNLATVGVVASNATTDTKGAAPGLYTFTRTGPPTAATAASPSRACCKR